MFQITKMEEFELLIKKLKKHQYLITAGKTQNKLKVFVKNQISFSKGSLQSCWNITEFSSRQKLVSQNNYPVNLKCKISRKYHISWCFFKYQRKLFSCVFLPTMHKFHHCHWISWLIKKQTADCLQSKQLKKSWISQRQWQIYMVLSIESLQIVYTDNLIDPANERGDLHVNSGHIAPAAAEAPGHQAGQFVVASVLTDQWAASVTLKEPIR